MRAKFSEVMALLEFMPVRTRECVRARAKILGISPVELLAPYLGVIAYYAGRLDVLEPPNG